jgi:hypothetical protein
MVNSTRLQLLRYWFWVCVCIKPQNILMFLSKWKRLQKCRPLLLLLFNRRFLSASKTQWIDHVFHPLLPFGATNWLCRAFSTLSRIFFWNLEFLEFRVPARKRQLHLSESLCIDFDSSALKKSLHSLCLEGFQMSYQAVAFHKSWVKWYSHKLYYEVYDLAVCRKYWYLMHAIIQLLLNSGGIVLWAIPVSMTYFTQS